MSQYINKIRTNSGDLQIDYNGLANLPTISNPNLLINSDFRGPVNQRGSTIYYGGANKCYTIDRWCMGANDFDRTVEIIDGGIKITNPNTTYIGSFQQVFESPLPSGDYTLSIKVTSISGAVTIFCDGANTGSQKNLEVGINTKTMRGTSISAVNIHLAASSSIVIEWIKLEVGTVATSFAPRIYAEELALCQRYFNRLKTTYPLLIAQQAVAENSTYINIPLPVSLRATPSIKYSNVKFMKDGVDGAWFDVTNVACVGFSQMGVTLQMDKETNYEAGVPYFLILPNSGYIYFDAEIY